MKGITRFLTKGLSGLNLPGPGTLLILLLPLVLMAGCNGSNESLGGGGGTPIVTSTSPIDGATNVLVTSVITATFSTAMDPATITTTTFTVSPATGSVSLSADGLTATFTPDTDLTEDTLYTATITTGAKSADGNALAANKVWSFRTGPAPTVTTLFPANLAVDVPVTTVVSATFSEAVDSLTVNTTNFTLKAGAALTPVTGSVALSPDDLTATFTPSGNLAPGTQFTASITGVRDIAGNPMIGSQTWTFTTVP